jgi:hypothetical protein
MNAELLEKVVHAVLYEGYILYPYRASSKKNCRERFTFGRVYPQDYSAAQQGAEPWLMQTECLLETTAEEGTLQVQARFLQPMARDVGVLAKALASWNGDEPEFKLVPELRVGEKLFQTWHEAVERKISSPPIRIPCTAKLPDWPGAFLKIPFDYSGSRQLEPIRNEQNNISGVLVRRQEAQSGTLEVSLEVIPPGLCKVSARVLNLTPLSPALVPDPEAVLLRTFASTHLVANASGARFVSLLDPPAQYQAAASQCCNLGAWPVLVGSEEERERDTILSSPIILYDYPKIAPESVEPFFDGTEIDELLTLRVQTMTDEEKLEMRSVDERARRLLERTESLSEQSLLKMHGTMRGGGGGPAATRSPAFTASHAVQANGCSASEAKTNEFDDFFETTRPRQSVLCGGVPLRSGDLVRLRPKARADLIDLALDGKTAVIEAVEEDMEGHVHLTVVVEDDPGRDLGLLRQPGHRFFYRPDEVEPLSKEVP